MIARFLLKLKLSWASRALRNQGHDKARSKKLAMLNLLRKEQGMKPFVPGRGL